MQGPKCETFSFDPYYHQSHFCITPRRYMLLTVHGNSPHEVHLSVTFEILYIFSALLAPGRPIFFGFRTSCYSINVFFPDC
jgi:hypothetical protein